MVLEMAVVSIIWPMFVILYHHIFLGLCEGARTDMNFLVTAIGLDLLTTMQ